MPFNTNRRFEASLVEERARQSPSRSIVGAAAGYRLWAPMYGRETAISYLENGLVAGLTPPLAGLRLLDAGCGTGRRLRKAGAAVSVGLDSSREMIAAGIAADSQPQGLQFIVADVRAMPVDDASFDVIWCRLVLGHLPELDAAYRELARVADLGAHVIVTDFHPAAHEAGHRRSFRAGTEVIELEHYVRQAHQHIEAAKNAGLVLVATRDASIGNDVRSFYTEAGMDSAFSAHVGLPVVLALAFRTEAAACGC